MSAVIEYLTILQQLQVKREDAPFSGMADLLLRHGRAWPRINEEAWPRGEMKQCFANAQRLATIHPELTYVEGYALSIIPVHHGWCVDPDGAVVDVTWKTRGAEYFGVPIRTRYLRKLSIATGWWTSVFDNWQSDPPLPILTGRHPAATWLAEWPRVHA